MQIQLTRLELEALESLAREGWCDGWLMDNPGYHKAGQRALKVLASVLQKPGRIEGLRFPGIVEKAKALGVSREHLYRVLVGERRSKALLKRYHDLPPCQNPGQPGKTPPAQS